MSECCDPRNEKGTSREPCACTREAPGPSLSRPPAGRRFVVGRVETPAGEIPCVSTRLDFRDRFGWLRVRWGVGRMHFRVDPGLYAIGHPTADSPVFVSANFKMSFDHLRSNLDGRDGWILVLDTRGINVWCAAGKGTFGTDEIVRRVEATRLAEVVSHRTLVLPQLGAPGVSAHEVKRRSGFRVVYGPVRAADLPVFLDAGMKATPEMRRVRFPIGSRAELSAIEIVGCAKYALLAAAAFLLLAGLGADGYSTARATEVGALSAISLAAACLAGAFLGPVFLPWLPGRSFSAKGAFAGLVVAALLVGVAISRGGMSESRLTPIAWILMVPAVASFITMNFTGASTYTSLSGVRKEMRRAVPLQAIAAAAGLGLWILGRFV